MKLPSDRLMMVTENRATSHNRSNSLTVPLAMQQEQEVNDTSEDTKDTKEQDRDKYRPIG